MTINSALPASQVLQIAFALLVGWLVGTDRVQIWHIVTVAFLLGIVLAYGIGGLEPSSLHGAH